MDEEELSIFERASIWLAGITLTLLVIGVVFKPDILWDDLISPYIWQPIVKDASVAGDSGYTLVNTFIYISLMFLSVITLQILFRRWRLPTDDRMVWALIAWVCVAPILRVLEDADMFANGVDNLFISPLIHIHLAGWLILSGFLGYLSNKGGKTEKEVTQMLMATLGLTYVLFVGLLYQPSWRSLEMGTTFALIGTYLGLFALFFILHNTWNWHPVSRAMMALASALIISGLGHWAQLLATPWAQESGAMPKENPLFLPIFVVIVIPLLITWAVYRRGLDDLRQIRLCGYEPGVIPLGIKLKEWEEGDNSDHPVEQLSNKAILATPMVAGMLFGQLCDGLATMVGIDWFGYTEKHPVSDMVIRFGDSFDLLGEGAWLFTLVKIALISTIVYLFSQLRVESKHQHMRVLIVLAVMIVGMAPGLRDVGRLILGV
jgi:uncharacterized membrane protein